MRIIDTVAAWLVLILALVHCSFVRKAYPEFGLPALWFLGAGLFMIAVAAINLLRIRYAAVAPGIRAVCIVANLVLLAYVAAFVAAVALRQNPQIIASLVLAALLTIFSIFRRPQHA